MIPFRGAPFLSLCRGALSPWPLRVSAAPASSRDAPTLRLLSSSCASPPRASSPFRRQAPASWRSAARGTRRG